ncbi:MAG: hypothetical protein VX614_04985 [Myxococcota bacterium]|nr:hypothetical protein [Myxococcota bacterium]
MKLRRLILMLLVSFPIADAVAKGEGASIPGPIEWIRVRHPEYPLSFELPARSEIRRVRRFDLAPMLRLGKRRPPLPVSRHRGPQTAPGPGHAIEIEIALLWLTPEFVGVRVPWLAALPERIGDPKFVAQGLRRALYRKIPKVELIDRGDDFIDGRRSRKLSISRRVGLGTRRMHSVRGGAVVIPVRKDTALVALARFGRGFSAEEYAALLDHVARSLEIVVWGGPRSQTLIAGAAERADASAEAGS